MYITPAFPSLCPITVILYMLPPVYSVVMSWLPWLEWYWSYCSSHFCFCLARSLSRSSRFAAGAFLLVSSVWSLETGSCSEQFSMGNCKAHLDLIPCCGVPGFTTLEWWTDALGHSTFSFQALFSRTTPSHYIRTNSCCDLAHSDGIQNRNAW